MVVDNYPGLDPAIEITARTGFRWVSRRLKGWRGNRDNDPPNLFPSMEAAIADLHQNYKVTRISAMLYDGSTLIDKLSTMGLLLPLPIKILLRDPGNDAIWRFPEDPARVAWRKSSITANIDRAQNSPRLHNVTLCARFYDHEPQHRLMVAEVEGPLQIVVYSGPYKLSDYVDPDGITRIDYTGVGCAMVKVTGPDGAACDYMNWFKHYFALAAD